jgi:hypothetical protein
VLGLITYKIKRFKQKLANVEENVTLAEEQTDVFVFSFLKTSFCSPINFEEGISSEAFPVKMSKE